MQTSEEKVGFDIACPQCKHQFTLVEQERPESRETVRPDSTGASPATEDTRQWIERPVEKQNPYEKPNPYANSVNSAPVNSAPVVDAAPAGGTIPPIYQGNVSSSFVCPYCRSRQPPIWKSEISTAGWITCVVLLVTTCFFFWVGFLIRDKYTVCSSCNVRLPRAFL